MPELAAATLARQRALFGGTLRRLGVTSHVQATLGRRAVLHGGKLRSAATYTPPAQHTPTPDITVELYDETNTQLLGPVQYSDSRRWTDATRGDGTAGLQVLAATDDQRAAALELAKGRHLRFYLKGEPAFAARIDSRATVEKATTANAKRTQVNAVDTMSVLKRAKNRPRGGLNRRPQASTRSYDWSSPEVSTSSWPNAVVIQPTISLSHQVPNTDPPWFVPWTPPIGWAEVFTPVIQCRPGVAMPVGRWPCRDTFLAGATGWYHIMAAGLDRITCHIDGIKVGASNEDPDNGWVTPLGITVWLTAGVHQIGFLVEKFARPAAPPGFGSLSVFGTRSLLAWNVFWLPQGEQTILGPGLRVAHSSASSKVLDFPASLPAPNWGVIARVATQEAVARGTLPPNFQRGFTDTHDSAGRPWPPNHATVARYSDDLDATLNQARAQGYDVDMSIHGYRLDIWAERGAGRRINVQVPATKVTRLEHPARPNALLVTWANGQFEVVDQARADAEGRVEDELELGDVRDPIAALVQANSQLQLLAATGEGLQVEMNITGDNENGPYQAWRPFDVVDVITDEVRVEQVTIAESTSGRANVETLELATRVEVEGDRVAAMLERGVPGTVAGTAPAATEIRWLSDGTTSGFVERERIQTYSQGVVVTEADDPQRGRSTDHIFEVATRISGIRIGSVGAPQAPQGIRVSVRRNGVEIGQLWLAQGKRHAFYIPNWMTFRVNDRLSLATLATSPGAGLLEVAFEAAPASPIALRPVKALPWMD